MTSSTKPGRLTLHYGSGESWTTAVHLRKAAPTEGVRVWDVPRGAHCRLESMGPKERYLWVESGVPSYPLDAHRTAATTAGYIIDVHMHAAISRLQSMLFDVVFVAQRDCIPELAACHPHVEWLPLAAPKSFLRLPRRARYDVAFVGRTHGLPARIEMLEALARRYTMNEWWRFHSIEEMGEVYSQSRIVLNIPVAGDLNMRFFEAMAAGAALLQPSIDNGAHIIATAGEHYIESQAFGEPQRLAAELTALLDSDLPERVGESARELIAQAHTYEHRMATAEGVMKQVELKAAPIRGFSRPRLRRYWATLSRTTGDANLVKQVLQEFPEAALRHPAYLGGALISAYRRTKARRLPQGGAA